jgi:glycolate oxidase iron-sulfur subunit
MTGSAAPAAPLSGFTATDAPGLDILTACVECGLCLPTCPTYREEYREQSSPRGRLHLMRAVADGRLDVLDPVFVGQMHECLGCRACEAVCPSGVRYGAVLEASRGQIEQARAARGRRSRRERALRWLVFDRLLRDMRLFRAACAMARLYERGGLRRLARAVGLPRALHLEAVEAQLPSMSRRFFVPAGQVAPAVGARRGRVGLFTGCIMHTAFAETHRATVRVLRRNGWEVVVPRGQGCCGALHAHAGDLDGGRDLLRRNVAAFAAAAVDVVVVNAAGCGATLKDAGRLLAGDPVWAERAAATSARVRDVTELLAAAPLRGRPGAVDAAVTYVDPCHLAHAQRLTAAPRALLRAVPGLRLVEMGEAALCCGSAGIYSVTRPAMGARLRERKLDHALATGATVIATANPGCMLQLRVGLRGRGRADVQVCHVVELLDAAYRAASAR